MNKFIPNQFLPAVACVLASFILGGCAGRNNSITSHGLEGLSAQPPSFLAGPAGVLLTNVDGFSAHVVVTTSVAGGETKTVSGELMGRSGRFLYTPMTGVGASKQMRKSGKTMSFIWDVPKNLGYALNEALQAYAPITPSMAVTNVEWDSKGARPTENINGHSCRRSDVTVAVNNGETVRFAVWRAEDAQHFPVQIQTLAGARPSTVSFYNIRFQVLPADALRPPDDFRKYDNEAMMVNELMIRETTTSKKAHVSEFQDADMPDEDAKWGHRPGQ